jgi:hypothetical protein
MRGTATTLKQSHLHSAIERVLRVKNVVALLLSVKLEVGKRSEFIGTHPSCKVVQGGPPRKKIKQNEAAKIDAM